MYRNDGKVPQVPQECDACGERRKCDETGLCQKCSKVGTVGFGMLYGRTPQPITEEEEKKCRDLIKKLFDAYPRLRDMPTGRLSGSNPSVQAIPDPRHKKGGRL